MKKINAFIDNSPFLTWCVQAVSLCITVVFLLMVSYFIVSCSPRDPERYKTSQIQKQSRITLVDFNSVDFNSGVIIVKVDNHEYL